MGFAIVLLALGQTAEKALPPAPPTPVLTARRVGLGTATRGAPPLARALASRGERRQASPASPEATLPALVAELAALPTPAQVRRETATVTPAPTPTPPRTEVIVYQVQPGDNLWLISQRFDLSQDTLAWTNEAVERNPDQLTIGQELYVLPVDGVWHTVQAGETLAAIAQRYQVEAQAIVDYAPNGLSDPEGLTAGQKLIIPGGVKPARPRPTAVPRAAAATSRGGQRLGIPAGAPEVPVEAPAQPGRFIWPAQGIITQGYSRWHGAIDIANKQGTPILAAGAGTVTFAGPSGGLGNAIQIDHGDGFATVYAHLHSISVEVGQAVQQGDQVGLMGTTGHSTGPHLHLIVTYNGGIVNPMDYLQ